MNFSESQVYLKKNLLAIYDSREAATITDWVLEQLTGFNKLDRLKHKDHPLNQSQQQLLDSYLKDLLSNKPIQYVLGEADFFGLRFFVNENVLIPRPETEELVQWVIEDTDNDLLSVLDIGTGSGCIAIALKAKKPQLTVCACDISEGALTVARQNAHRNNTSIDFFKADVLDKSQSSRLDLFNIIVSNPPYIPPSGKKGMSENVLSFEPHLALFTPEDDPFLFYREIGLLGQKHLYVGGRLYFEIHAEGAGEVIGLLDEQGYNNIVLRNDLYGKPRMISAERL